ncbi:hypothetical protein KC338_g304 [Hortaea werneckii]|nr:hypothetical protein KC338_g304 [Hortaea werneckii]
MIAIGAIVFFFTISYIGSSEGMRSFRSLRLPPETRNAYGPIQSPPPPIPAGKVIANLAVPYLFGCLVA